MRRQLVSGKVWPVAAGTALLLLVAAFFLWRLVLVPRQVEELYAQGEEAYQAGNVAYAAEVLERLHQLDREHVDANVLLGYSYWRLERLEEAEASFVLAHESEPERVDVVRGLGLVLLALGKNDEAIRLLENIGWNHPLDADIQRTLAEAYRRGGNNVAAARIYRELLWRNPGDFEAEQVLLQMFGYPQLTPDIAFELPDRLPPAELALPFRVEGETLQAFSQGAWRTTYASGVIMSPARPGEYSVTASLDFRTYREWLDQIGEMNATTVRVYTILPPAFYQALAAYNAEAEEPLWLIQGVWIDDLAENLFDPETREAFEDEVRATIDVIHGRSDLACRGGHYCGVYTADVSPWVIGLALGRDLEPSLVRRTDQENAQESSHRGEYVSLGSGTPTEAWFAAMLDLAARYETETYNAQRPLTIVNWPGLDPLDHPSQVPLEDELRLRRALGEIVPDTLPRYSNDLDEVSVDVGRFEAGESFEGGLFALYHVFQHRPDFLSVDPGYLTVRDSRGPNPFLGYLRDLKSAYPDMPVLIGAFGVSSSLETTQLHPLGWNNGGLSEAEQADLLVRFNQSIRDAGLAGGIVFEWLDEWWKHVSHPLVSPLEASRASDPIWLNRLDPEEAFGLAGFHAFGSVPLLRGDTTDWRNAETLYRPGAGSAGGSERSGILRGVQAMADYAYLYLRVDLATASRADWIGRSLWIALNTVTGEAGAYLPADLEAAEGEAATFLVQIDELREGRLLVAENYSPWESRPIPGREGLTRIAARRDLALSVDSAGFQELVIEVNPPRVTSDGDYLPAVNRSWSPLLPAQGGSSGAAGTDRAWYVDDGARTVELRIPWSKLLIMNPAEKLVFGGTVEGRLQSRETEGMSVAVFVVETEPGIDGDLPPVTVLASLPGAAPSGEEREPPAVFAWNGWSEVFSRPYLKQGYYALQELWGGWPRWGAVSPLSAR